MRLVFYSRLSTTLDCWKISLRHLILTLHQGLIGLILVDKHSIVVATKELLPRVQWKEGRSVIYDDFLCKREKKSSLPHPLFWLLRKSFLISWAFTISRRICLQAFFFSVCCDPIWDARDDALVVAFSISDFTLWISSDWIGTEFEKNQRRGAERVKNWIIR